MLLTLEFLQQIGFQVGAAGDFEILTVQRNYLRAQCSAARFVADYVVSMLEPLGAADLACHNGPHRSGSERTAPHHARNLLLFAAIDYENASCQLAIGAGFE